MIDDLLHELKVLLDAEFAQTGFRAFPAKPEKYQPPTVHLYALPVRRAQPKGQGAADPAQDMMAYAFPFIVLRPVSGEDAEVDGYGARTQAVDVWFLCGVYTAGDEASGARDLESMMGRVRSMLLGRRLYLKRFERQLPITWDVGDGVDHAQPHPHYGGMVRARFSATAPIETLEPDEEVSVYGQLEK